MTNAIDHNHDHSPNRFAVIPTAVRVVTDERFSGKGVTIAFLDSGFCAHPDLVLPRNRIAAYSDVTGEQPALPSNGSETSWHGTQTTVVAAGNGHLCDGIYRGLAYESDVVLVKVSNERRITEDDIALGLEWVIANHERLNIRVLNISLGGDEDVPCSKSVIDQLAEKAIELGIVVVVAAGNSDGVHPIPPANSPSVITVGGYSDRNRLSETTPELYHSSFGATADGTVKPEVIAPAMFVAAPILPGTLEYERAAAFAKLVAVPDYALPALLKELSVLSAEIATDDPAEIRVYVESALQRNRIVAAHYQHVDGTSFAAPIVSSIVAQMIEANPKLTPLTIKNILIDTAERITGTAAIRQGYGVVNARRAIASALNEQHALETEGCNRSQVVNGRILFVFHDDRAKSVAVAGDFNSWDARSKLSKNASGLWVAEMPAPAAGEYQYKFVVNGHRWIDDPGNGKKVPDGFGGLNSLLVIE